MMDQSVDLTMSDSWNDKIKNAPGLLTIKVIRARKLAAKDGIISKSSDPFVVVEIGTLSLLFSNSLWINSTRVSNIWPHCRSCG